MYVTAIKTHRIEAQEPLQQILDQYIHNLVDNDILVITSKVLSVTQGCLVKTNTISKRELIDQQADWVLETASNPYNLYLTIKQGILLPSAGIDESNVAGAYAVYPDDIQAMAVWIWAYLKKQQKINHLGILITDSHTTIMRRGVMGIALGWCGFQPLYSYIHQPDLYDRLFKVTQVNILDALAAAAVLVMGEGREQTPFALIQQAPKVSFLDRPPTVAEEKSIQIAREEDLYAPLLQAGKWSKKT